MKISYMTFMKISKMTLMKIMKTQTELVCSSTSGLGEANNLPLPLAHLYFLDRHLDHVVVDPGQAHLHLLLQVRPPGQGSTVQGILNY